MSALGAIPCAKLSHNEWLAVGMALEYEGYSVMNPCDCFIGRTCQDDKGRNTVFHPVKPRKPQKALFFRPERIFLPCVFLFIMFPFKIP